MKSKDILQIEQILSNPIRWSVSFVPQNLLKKHTTSQLNSILESVVSTAMKKVYDHHCVTKTQESILNMDRELLYVDASKKWDFDLFTYMTKLYFNISNEDVRLKYNRNHLQNLQWYNKDLFPDEMLWQVWSTDWLFDLWVNYFKWLDYFKENGSDWFIGFMPMSNIQLLMYMNDQNDLNIFLDNIHSVSQEEMLYINNLIRSWLLMWSEKRLWLYINNGSGKWNYSAWEWNLHPQDVHDMKIYYF